jgi:GTPase SAR1 family protein
MYGNKVAAVVIPHDQTLLSKLEILNLGYNDLAYLPDELDQLKNLKTLKLMTNFLEKVPMRVCEMDLKTVDVSFNPVIQPPLETCERGIASMRRYYHCLRLEEQSKSKTMEEVQKKMSRQKRNNKEKEPSKKKGYGGFLQNFSIAKSPSQHASKHNEDPIPAKASATVAASPTIDVGSPKMSATPTSRSKNQEQGVDSSGRGSFDDGVDTVPRDVHMDANQMEVDVDPGKTANDTLKVIFVGMAMVGKTSMIKRLIRGRDAVIPTHVERTVGVDIYAWDPKKDSRFEHIDSKIELQDKELAETCGDVNVKFSVWDFAGQHVYHATHELFFSSRALYVLVWDMGATNRATLKRKASDFGDAGEFKLSYDSESDEEEDNQDNVFAEEEEARRADRALERDIDEKVQFWVDCIQSSAPGAAILPVASFNDYFAAAGGDMEARRRCSILKNRLLRHEARRMEGLDQRLQAFVDENRPDDPAAQRLRKLQYTRPRLIFGDGDDGVVRVSGTQYTGFEKLTEKIVHIATGRDKVNSRYAVFHGHVGAQIPRMFVDVREAVRTLRNEFKVVEWGYFLNQLKGLGLTNEDYISEALHFLTNIGELSYFGGVGSMPRKDVARTEGPSTSRDAGFGTPGTGVPADDRSMEDWEDLDDDDMDDDRHFLSMDETSITAPSTEDGSLTTVEDYMTSGLNQFVFLNPRWLVAAVACILRHDLDNEIKETRRLLATGATIKPILDRRTSFEDAQMNCPVITAEDACLLWQAKKITKKAAKIAQQHSNNMAMSPFEFLQLLLVRFGVFVPIDATIERALLGGREYAGIMSDVEAESMLELTDDEPKPVAVVNIERPEAALKAKFFFLPSLLGPGEPSEAWTYKNTDSWKTTLCHSILFPDGVPPGLMERLTANVLSAIYAVCNQTRASANGGYVANDVATYDGTMTIREVLCWRTAFFIKLGTVVPSTDGVKRESVVEIFATLADQESRLCVGSDFMGVGMRRLIICGRGQVGNGGRKIWKGGYLLGCKCVRRVIEGYGGLEYEEQGFCPECLSKRSINEASSWESTAIRTAVRNSEGTMRCQHGHSVDTRFLAGPVDGLLNAKRESIAKRESVTVGIPGEEPVIPVRDLLGGVVVVGLWDGKTSKVVRVGSGFIVDRRRGLIVTASHTLMNIWGDKNYPFGDNYYGLRQGKVVIGVIPRSADNEAANGRDMAVFRYFAKIVAKDPSMENGECHIDACVLRITTRLENDVGGDGDGCGDQPEILLLNNPVALKNEKLQSLRVSENVELEEQVRIMGYNQGGEGLLGPGERLNRFVDFARGYVCKKFASGEQEERNGGNSLRDRFKPREEIAVICPTIGGHSGGPCVNQQGEVIGILSRADPAESQRCYISPTSEWKHLIKIAKRTI